MFNTEREKYEEIWDDIKPFVEYGALRDRKFYEKTKNAVIFRKVDGGFVTLDEYKEKNTKEEGRVFYATDKIQQSRYISLLKEEEIDTLLLDSIIDTQFITLVERENENVKFVRCDSETPSSVKAEEGTTENEVLKELFVEAIAKEGVDVTFTKLKNEKTPAIITLPEEDRRFADMMKIYSREGASMMGTLPEKLVVNTSNALVLKISQMAGENQDMAKKLARQVYLIALVSQRQLNEAELEDFVENSTEILTNGI
jgi:molecular chaperone HtpG